MKKTEKKIYKISIELDSFETVVTATSRAEAKKKAISKLNRKKPESYIRSDYRTNKKCVNIEDEKKID